MTSDEIFIKLKELIKANFDWVDTEGLSSQSTFESLGIDSIGMVKLQVQVEDNFGVYFKPGEMNLGAIFSSIQSVVEFLNNLNKIKSYE
jgi:acyl carrier protein